jgi:2-phosphosulfolactate phosphatase
MRTCYRQSQYPIRFEWGEAGVGAVGHDADVVIIVDVLSFSTAVDVAVSRGAAVMPARWPGGDAAEIAARTASFLAVPRRAAGPANPYSLSPVSLQALPDDSRLILPSPNGAACVVTARELGVRCIIAGSLRNARAVADAARSKHSSITVIAAGERWENGALRPALEDYFGAGAILSALDATQMSPEAKAAAGTYRTAADVPTALYDSVSAVELIEDGFAGDVDIALQLDASTTVPVLDEDGFFRVGSLR